MLQRVRGTLMRMRAIWAATHDDERGAQRWLLQAAAADPERRELTRATEAWIARRQAEQVESRRRYPTFLGLDAYRRMTAGDWVAAEDAARRSLLADPGDTLGRYVLARALATRAHDVEAEAATLAALQLLPTEAALLNNLGGLEFELHGNVDAAEAIFSETVRVGEDSVVVATAQSNLQILRGADQDVRDSTRHLAVRNAVSTRGEWRAEVRRKLENLLVAGYPIGPRGISDLQPGDVLLLSPRFRETSELGIEDRLKEAGSRLIGVAQQFYTGAAFRGEFQGEVSHALTFLGNDVRGRALFLDNTTVFGPHVIGQTEFEQDYGARLTFVARPEVPVVGRALLQFALERIREQERSGGSGLLGSRFGVFGSNEVVCSELAGLAIARATANPQLIAAAGHGLGPIDITPSDFLDNTGAGKYFVITLMGNR